MEEGLEIPKWIEKIMRLWVRDAVKPLPKELREVWRDLHRKKAEELRKVDREKLSGWQRAWIEWLLDVNEKASEEERDLKIDDSEVSGGWYENLEFEVMHAYVPTINFRALLQKRPSQTLAITCGEWVGHEYMMWCAEQDSLLEALSRSPEEFRKAMISLMEHLRPQRLKLVNKALSIANKQPVRDSRQFFRGYYLALDKGTISEKGQPVGSTYATPIYLTMYSFAEFVPRLKNNRELMEWLKAMLGKSESWNDSSQKRIEKIAQRIDLHLGQQTKWSDT